MSDITKFSPARRREPTVEPDVPATPEAMHPAVQDHIARYSETFRQLDAERAENDRLRTHIADVERELEIASRQIEMLSAMIRRESEEKDRHFRTSVEIRTQLSTIATMIRAAELKAASEESKQISAEVLDKLENEINAASSTT